MTLYRDTIGKALREELGTVKLTDLTAGNVQKALAATASRSSTRTVQIAHNVLVRVIRQAERDDLVARNVAALVKPPKGQGAGRPSKSLTPEQAVALRSAARGTRLEAYITWVPFPGQEVMATCPQGPVQRATACESCRARWVDQRAHAEDLRRLRSTGGSPGAIWRHPCWLPRLSRRLAAV